MKLFILGYPGPMGGANTECWHTVKLWRQAGWDVTLVPTWGSDPDQQERLDAIGAKTVCVGGAGELGNIPGLAGGIVVGFCNSHFTSSVGTLRRLGCRLVWVNCMTFCYPGELEQWKQHGVAEAFVFQSQFQRRAIEPHLIPLGYRPELGYLIRGAFDPHEYPFNPRGHGPKEEFVIGRLSRPDADKWSSNTWSIYGRVPYRGRKALAMGWNEKLQQKLGRPPQWATALKPNEITPREFLARCHCMMPINGGARENWPRVGLEAMSAGVPLVCQNAWGWREMVVHGRTGYLGSDPGGGNDEELIYYAARLAHDEPHRLAIAEAARARAEELCDPAAIAAGWQRLFEGLGREERAAA